MTITSKLKSNEINLTENRKRFYYNSNVQETFVDQQKWKLYKFTAITEFEASDVDAEMEPLEVHKTVSRRVDQLKASCFVSRYPQYYLWNAFSLIFLITICSLNTFAIDQKIPQGRLQPAFTLLLTSISFKVTFTSVIV